MFAKLFAESVALLSHTYIVTKLTDTRQEDRS